MADDLPEYQTFGVAEGCSCQPCVDPAEFHHPKHQPTHAPWARPGKAIGGKPGKGQRCSDWFGFGLCVRHHGQLHAKSGPFSNMSKEELRAWQDDRTRRLQLRWAMRHPDRLPELVEPRAKKSKLESRKSKAGNDWTVAGIIDLLKKQARISNGEVAAVLHDIAQLIERGKVH